MSLGPQDWDCLGPAPGHPADLEQVESLHRTGNTEIDIRRCRTCAQLYLVDRHESSDWSGGHDYYEVTTTWKVLGEDEVEAVRQQLNYQPRSDRSHRHSTGWRSG